MAISFSAGYDPTQPISWEDRATQGWMSWLQGSVGVTMFLNARSAMLQLISTINYTRFSTHLN